MTKPELGAIMKRPSYFYLYAILILFGGALLRLWQLGHASLWTDENFTSFFAHAPAKDFFDFLLIDGVHVPFYFMVMRLVPAEPDLVLRLPSAFFGILSIAVLMGVVNRLYGSTRLALWAGALLAFNPYHIWYSRSARPYALFFLLALAANYYFLRLLQGRRSWQLWLLFTLTTMGAYMTHYFAIALPLAQYITLAFVLRGQADFFRKWFVCHLIAGVPLLIWIGALTQQEVISFGIAWIPPVTLTDPFVTIWNLLVGYMGRDSVLYLPAIVIGSALLLMGTGYALRSRRDDVPALYSFWVIVGALVPVALISQFRAVYHDRYFMVMLPAVLLLVLRGSQQAQWRQWASFLLVAVLIFGAATVLIRIANHEEEREGWRAASQHIERNFQPGDQLMVLNGSSLIPFRRYTDDSFDPPTIEIEFDEPAPLVAGQRMWVVVRNPNESLHYPFAMDEFDPFAVDGSKLSEWMRANLLAYVDQWKYPGVTVLLFAAN